MLPIVRSRIIAALLATLFPCLALAPGLAQQPTATAEAPKAKTDAAPKKAKDDKGKVSVTWVVPEAPAAAALDIARSTTNAPSPMRRLSFELLNSEEATGLAAETSPFLIARSILYGPGNPKRILTAQDYQGNVMTRALAGFSLSAAAVRSGENGDRAAAALSWTVFNRGDPYYSINRRQTAYDKVKNFYLFDARPGATAHSGCVNEALLAADPSTATPREETAEEAADEDSVNVIESGVDEKLAKALATCVKQFKELSWNATALRLVATNRWSSLEGGLDRLGPSGVSYGAVLSYGFDRIGPFNGFEGLQQNSQLLLSATRSENMRIVDDKDIVSRRDESTIGLRLRIAPDTDGLVETNTNGDRFHISGEAAFSRHDYPGRPEQEQWTYTAGAEWRIAENMWIAITAEERSGDNIAGDESRAGVQLRWALNDTAQFKR